MKISKQKAHEAAIKIATPMMEKIKLCDSKMGESVRSLLLAEVPKEIVAMYEKHPAYFNTNSYEWLGRLKGANISVTFKEMPSNSRVSFKDKHQQKVTAYLNEKETLQEKYEQAVLSIENTILALGTYGRVEKEFPEAFPFLGAPATSMALIINVAPVRKLACSLIPGCSDTAKKKTKQHATTR